MQLSPAETQEQLHGSQISGIRCFFFASQTGHNVAVMLYLLVIYFKK